ncbi:hypothetical protein Trydic_g1547 [Trypoxylus dichotomus]
MIGILLALKDAHSVPDLKLRRRRYPKRRRGRIPDLLHIGRAVKCDVLLESFVGILNHLTDCFLIGSGAWPVVAWCRASSAKAKTNAILRKASAFIDRDDLYAIIFHSSGTHH